MINMFGERLKKLRKKNNVTQEYIASRVMVNRTTIVKWEKGTAEPSISHLRILSKTFNVSVAYLLGEDEFTIFLISTAEIFCKAKKKETYKDRQLQLAQWIVFWNSLLEYKETKEEKEIKWNSAYKNIGFVGEDNNILLDYPKDYNDLIINYIVNIDDNEYPNTQYVLPNDVIYSLLLEKPALYYFMYGYYPNK